jgi:hypothetical protein
LPSHDGFLFLTEPLNFLLDSNELFFLFCSCIFISFFVPVLYSDLIELSVTLNELYQ